MTNAIAIGVIGNSHAAAYKLGWEQLKGDYPQISLRFYGATGAKLSALRVRKGALVTDSEDLKASLVWTSGGQDHIPGSFDAYIVVGLGFSFAPLMRVLRAHRPPAFFDPQSDHHLISEDCFEQAMDARLKGSVAVTTLDKLKRVTDAPVIFAPNPYPTKGVLASPEADYWACIPARERVFDFYCAALDQLRSHCQVQEQPAYTIEERMFTRENYTAGSVRLKEGMSRLHPAGDYEHMNAEFGACALKEILDSEIMAVIRGR